MMSWRVVSRCVSVWCLVWMLPAGQVGAADVSAAGVGRGEVLNFSLLDYAGKHYELRRADGRAVVLFFTGPGCPVARQIAPKLQKLSERFGKEGVVFWMIN